MINRSLINVSGDHCDLRDLSGDHCDLRHHHKENQVVRTHRSAQPSAGGLGAVLVAKVAMLGQFHSGTCTGV
jgi:hypothetical protein